MAQSVGARIAQARREKAAREQRDITQRDMAKAVHVSGASVSDWEGDKAVPRDDTLAKLAKYLGVTPAFLRYGVIETAPVKPARMVEAKPVARSHGPAKKRKSSGADGA